MRKLAHAQPIVLMSLTSLSLGRLLASKPACVSADSEQFNKENGVAVVGSCNRAGNGFPLLNLMKGVKDARNTNNSDLGGPS